MDTDIPRTLAEVDRLRTELKGDLLELRAHVEPVRPFVVPAALAAGVLAFRRRPIATTIAIALGLFIARTRPPARRPRDGVATADSAASAAANDGTDPTVILTARHRALEALLDRWGTARAAGDGRARQRLAAEIADRVREHVAAEESTLYPTMRGRVEQGLIDVGLERHRELLAFLPEIAVLGPSSEAFRDTMDLLVAAIRGHLATEDLEIILRLRGTAEGSAGT